MTILTRSTAAVGPASPACTAQPGTAWQPALLSEFATSPHPWPGEPAPLVLGRPGGLPEAARLAGEGVLRHVVGDVYVPVDVEDSPTLRAAAVGALVPAALSEAGAAICWETAAWVYCGGSTPDAVHLAVSPPANRSPARPPLAVHQMRLTARDVREVDGGGLRITSPARTAVDLARRLPQHQALTWMDDLAGAAGLTPSAALARLHGMQRYRDVTRARVAVSTWVAGRQSARVPVMR